MCLGGGTHPEPHASTQSRRGDSVDAWQVSYRGLGGTRGDTVVGSAHDVRSRSRSRRAEGNGITAGGAGGADRVSGSGRIDGVGDTGNRQLTYWKADWSGGEAGDGSTAREADKLNGRRRQ